MRLLKPSLLSELHQRQVAALVPDKKKTDMLASYNELALHQVTVAADRALLMKQTTKYAFWSFQRNKSEGCSSCNFKKELKSQAQT